MGDVFKTKEKEELKSYDPEYLKVRLSSAGKLKGVPEVLHVRNYRGTELTKTALINTKGPYNNKTEVRNKKIIMSILDNMIQEDINVMDLSYSDVLEIFLNIYANYWSTTIEFEYSVSKEEKEWLKENNPTKLDQLEKGIFNPIGVIDLADKSVVDFNPMKEEFKEPFSFEETEASFILDRFSHSVIISDYLDKKFSLEDQKFVSVENRINYNKENLESPDFVAQPITDDELKGYQDYMDRKSETALMLSLAIKIDSYDGKPCNTIEEKLEAFELVNPNIWPDVSDILTTYGGFGINRNINVKSPITEEITSRRFSFRLDYFLPTMGKKATGGSHVQFGT
jgi:hypothetical protein